MNPKVFENNKKLTEINLDGNSWDCSNCEEIQKLYLFLKKMNNSISELMCETPPNLNGKTWESACFKKRIKKMVSSKDHLDELFIELKNNNHEYSIDATNKNSKEEYLTVRKVRSSEEWTSEDDTDAKLIEVGFIMLVIIFVIYYLIHYLCSLSDGENVSEFQEAEEIERLNHSQSR